MADICILDNLENGILTLTLNRPKKKNAFNSEMMELLPKLLAKASVNEDVKIVVITGKGEYFTSGNDINNFFQFFRDDDKTLNMEDVARSGTEGFSNIVKSFIDFPKPLVAVVNGPAVGMGVTLLGLCDLVYASDKATFHTPFAFLGLTPEGCSSYTFPSIMGHSGAARFLLFGEKIGAAEAFRLMLVTEVFPHQHLSNVWHRLKHYTSLPINAVVSAKSLLRKDRGVLHKVNESECNQLMERWTSPEFLEGVANFLQKKSKL